MSSTTLISVLKWLGGLLVVALVILFVIYWKPVVDAFTLLEPRRPQEAISYEDRQGEFIKLFSKLNKVERIPPNYETNTSYKKVPPLMIATKEENDLFRALNTHFTEMVTQISKENDIPITVDRTIYDIYYNYPNVIYDAVVLVENKRAEITERYFLKVFVNYTSPQTPTSTSRPQTLFVPRTLFVSIDFPTEEKIAGFNARTDEIHASTLKIKPVYEAEIEKLLAVLYELNRVERFPPYVASYIKYPNFTKFLFGDFFRNSVLRIFKEKLTAYPEYKDLKTDILRDVYDIYYLDTLKDRNFIFSIDFFNRTSAISLPLTIFATVRDIDRFLTDTGDFSPDTRTMLKPADFILNRIEKREISEIASVIPSPLHITFEPSSQYDMGDYYRFRSKLNLMGPTFEEDYTSMKITPEMEAAFKEKITPETIQKRLSMCFGIDTANNYTNQIDCEKGGGVWDAPPVSNKECPFYKANVLYPNQFGGIVGNGCELPRNMQKLGYKGFVKDSQFQPLCYNCKDNLINDGTLGYCCESQKTTLLSPDYAFNGDRGERFKNRELLELNGLSYT